MSKSAPIPRPMRPGFFPDCLKCTHGVKADYGLVDCNSRHSGPTPQPNCNVRKVKCVYFEAK